MKKRVFPSELAYVCGIVLIAISVTLTEKADFGLSMIVAPAYLVYRWLSPMWSFVTFGMAEYCFQALLLLMMCLLLRRFRISWLFAFFTAVIYGFVLDGCMLLGAHLPADTVAVRLCWFVLGMLLGPAGVSMMFHTYIAPEVYELFVKEGSAHFGRDIHRFKTGYDWVSCAVGVAMSFAVFGMWQFVGVNWGTIAMALINGWIISRFSKLYEHLWRFEDKLPWRAFFTGEEATARER